MTYDLRCVAGLRGAVTASASTRYTSGQVRYPTADPFGVPFSDTHDPARYRVAGQLLAGGWIGIYDGIQMDLEFIKKCFDLQRYLTMSYLHT